MSLADLRKGHLVTVLASGTPISVTRIRGVLVAGRYSTGKIGRTQYWRADGTCENDDHLAIRVYRARDEERIEAAREVAEAESKRAQAVGHAEWARAGAKGLEKEAANTWAYVPAAETTADAAGVALADARARLAKIDEVTT